ncbi:Anaerobic ribonucleoside-triphosphate reductase [Vibrio mediterranei]|uniref:Anaerobic ribonucleoside-triphosphate reductase n=1 Tax=Vibrio mediterranei TaxID=689 RepID=A0ABX5D976_9VIBR|nr:MULTISPECIES: anaerobic ribonucleoside-triphosphate reductase [Vibrio]KFA97835.1 ribonucleoside-triphosphate reductase [Vibrio sp. ER1A]MCG9662592.1 anaerobic ribonucleoside-triphosphate reductase [Vibrio mediterranei]MCG9788784.1 anaerobic ribonucleoside-triphosphate reductase [Vibrio mediterranei]MCY9853810.1 anaerobic ribonucleoside-triphosphate reductase [Vibrio mediterranei]NUW75011.1 anaerobic ribonucleoside-triphosphate reductase [Vibrio mediterranei]
MKTIVIKRDGSRAPFTKDRIEAAVVSAAEHADKELEIYAKNVALAVELKLQDCEHVDIQEIQTAVENELMQGPYKGLARSYIEYRHDRDIAREKKSALTKEIEGLIEESNADLLNENANKDGKVIPTQRDLLAGIVAKHYAKTRILPRDVVQAHDEGDIHYHDLDYAPFFPMFNCMLIDLKGMLTHGFKMGNAEIDTPKSISTATAVTAQIIAQVASHIYGGTTINRIDEVLAPYVKASYDKHLQIAQEWDIHQPEAFAQARTEKECYDAFQSLEYEVNTLHTANGQTPFVTFGFGLGTSWESKLIQQSILKNRIAGLGKNSKTAVFPKLVFAIKDGLNHKSEDPNYDVKQLALECASKRMYPDILNYDKVVEVTGSFKTPMGCRSFLGTYEENGELQHEGRNNLGVVSLNLPRIAIKANGSVEKFYELLNDRLVLARKALETRISRLEKVKARVAPILYMEGACGVRLKADDSIAPIFKNGRASISLGYIGIHEMVTALFGNDVHMYDDNTMRDMALDVIKHMKQVVNQWAEETGYAFSLYGTPSENLCSRFCQIDTKEFGIIEGVTDKGYYTNSFHLDVQKKVNPYDKIDFEMPYPEISSGGFICYGEFPNMQRNIEALENVWDYSYTRVPYYGTNTPIDECYECGYMGEFDCTSKGFTCPKCGNHDSTRVSVTRRVCGYLGSPDARPFNFGKQEEVKRRVKHL